MARLYIITMGFHENFALRRLGQASRDDRVVVVTVKPAAKTVIRAYESLKVMASKMGVSVEGLVEIDPGDVEGAVSQILSLASRAGDGVVIDASGGSRSLVAITLMAALILSRSFRVDYYIQSDVDAEWEVRITHSHLRLVTRPLTREKKAILEAVVNRPGRPPEELARDLNMHSKTLRNHLSELKQAGLIVQRGRGSGVYPTRLARLAIVA